MPHYTSCHAQVDLAEVQVKCFCGSSTPTYLPRGTQLLYFEASELFEGPPYRYRMWDAAETPPDDWTLHPSEIRTPCQHCGKVLKTTYAPGLDTIRFSSIRPEARASGDERVFDHGPSLIFKLVDAVVFPVVERHNRRDHSTRLHSGYVGALTDIAVMLALAMGAIAVPPIAVDLFATGKPPGSVELLGWIARGTLAFAALYYAFTTERETLIAMGDLETRLLPSLRHGLHASIDIMVNWAAPLLLWIALVAVLLFSCNACEPGALAGKAGEALIAVLVFQVLAGPGVLFYALWGIAHAHPPNGLFKNGHLDGMGSLEKLGQIALYNVLFVFVVLSLGNILGSVFFPQESLPFLSPCDFANVGCPVGAPPSAGHPPLRYFLSIGVISVFITGYFTYLGKVVSASRSADLDMVRRRRRSLAPDDPLRAVLEQEERKIGQAGKWITGIEFGSRVLLALVLTIGALLTARL